MSTPEELRAQYLALQASGAPLPKPPAVGPARDPVTREPAPPPIPIHRDGTEEEQLAEIVAGIAALWGDEWTYSPDDERRSQRQRIQRSDGAKVYFYVSRGRIEARGDWPSSNLDGSRERFYSRNPQWCDDCHYTTTTHALSRSVEDLAADVRSRFLPGYLAEWDYQCAARDTHDAREVRVDQDVRTLAAILGANPQRQYGQRGEGRCDRFYWGNIGATRVRCEVSPGDASGVKLEIDCGRDLAAKILDQFEVDESEE